MGNLANKFLEAVNIISDAKTKSAGFDRSVQVTIRKLYQEDSTKYEVEYEGALKTATGAAGYKTNDVVWAVIPKNDLTQTLQIIGLASSIAADKQVLRSEDDEFEKVTPNLAILNSIQTFNQDGTIILWQKNGGENNILNLNAEKINSAIADSLYFEIGTEIESTIAISSTPNFGVRCYFNDNQIFTLDINDVSGNPYYLRGEQQKKIFEIQEGQQNINIEKVEIFASGLKEDDTVEFSNFSFYGCRDVDYIERLSVNLLIKEDDAFRELGSLSNNNYLFDKEESIIIKANLRNDGILIQDKDLLKYTYIWYFKTLKNGLPIKIVIGDNPNTKDSIEALYFDKEENDNRIIPNEWFSIIENAPNQLRVSAAALFMPNSWIYCEVIDEKGNKVKTSEGQIDNVDKSYQLILDATSPAPDPEDNGKYKFTLSVKNEINKEAALPNGLQYKWYFSESGKEKELLDVSASSIVRDTTDGVYYVEVYTINNFLVLTDDSSIGYIPNVPSQDDLSLVITGKSVYLCKQDGFLQEQIIEPLKVWIYSKGKLQTEITNKYSIKWALPTLNSMLKVIEGKEEDNTSLTFAFGTQKYLLDSYNNNTVSVTVTDLENENNSKTASIEITFLKNGQPGTNGTNIICYFADKTTGRVLQYYDGDADEIDSSNIALVRVDGGTAPEITEVVITEIVNKDGDTCLKTTVSAGDATYYAYLPIIAKKDESTLTLIEPSSAPYVQFSSSGKIAEDMPKTFTCSGLINNATINSKYLDISYSGNTFALQVKENVVFKGDEILPVVVINADAKGENADLRVPILLLTNRFEYAAINGWDGTSIKLDEENDTILAPMAGFGKKEEDNSFTGVVLGDIISDNLTTDEVNGLPSINDANFNIIYRDISQGENSHSYYVLRTNKNGEKYFASSPPPDFQGIIGLNGGEQTFSLNANNGSAWFKGHIEATSGKIGAVAIDAVMPTNISGNYSWKFSPTDGLFMWKGAQDTIDPLLKIDNTGLKISGEINATQGGNIGGFTINPTAQTLISGNIGMSANSSNYAFWAGHSDPNLAPFRVGHDGSIVAEKLQIDSGQVQGLFTIETLKSTDVTAENLKVKHLQGADGSFAGTLSGASGTFGTLKTNGSGALYYTSIGNGIYCGNQNSNSQTTGTVFCVNNSSQSQSIVGYWVQNTTDHKLPSKEVFLRGICVSGDDGGADTSGASGGVPHAYRGITRDWNVSGSAVLHIVSGIIVDIT